MAKRPRNVGSAQNSFDRILATIPARAEFSVAMEANCTNEAWSDIDTNLDDGEAWLIYGGEFWWWHTTNNVPMTPYLLASDANWYCLQVHRNDDSELLLDINDDDVLATWMMTQDQFTTTSGAASEHWFMPFRFGSRTITFSEKLRVIFRTISDDVNISDPNIDLRGRLFYDRIKAPSIGQSKLGQIADL